LVELQQLSKLPSLTGFTVKGFFESQYMYKAAADTTAEIRAALPPKLRKLSVVQRTDREDPNTPQIYIDAFAGLEQLAELRFRGRLFRNVDLNLQPLARLAHLTRLEILSEEPSVKHARALKNMSALRYLDLGLGEWTAQQLAELCKQPHQLQQLQSIDLGPTHLTAAHMGELQNLPSLTSIQPRGMEAACIPFLSSFKSLSKFTFHPRMRTTDEERVAYKRNMLATFPQCHALTKVYVQGDILPSGERVDSALLTSLSKLPHLRSLTICDAPWFRDVSCLTLLPQLEVLVLVGCPVVWGEEESLRPLLGLKQLRILHLCRSGYLPLHFRDLIRPPSPQHFPCLEVFRYENGNEFDVVALPV
jgi:hypothetical protein